MKKNVIMVAAIAATSANAFANESAKGNEVMNLASAVATAVETGEIQTEREVLATAPYYSRDAYGHLFILNGADMLKSAENICKARKVYTMAVPEGMQVTKELGVYKLKKDGKESVQDSWVLTSGGTARYAQPFPQANAAGWMSRSLDMADVMGGMDFVAWATSHEYYGYNSQGNGFCYGTDAHGNRVIIFYEA